MNKISLRWRITLLMGGLLLSTCVLLTVLSIENMTNRFVIPILYPSIHMGSPDADGGGSDAIPFDGSPADFQEGVYYVPELKLNVENAQKSFSAYSYLYMMLAVIGGMIATYYLAGHAMRPISKLNDEIGTIGVNNLSKRINVPQTRDEIENLSRSFNELLSRLELDFGKEKRFSANAAHELKTPLTTIMTSAQVLAMNDSISTEEYRENLDITLQSVRRLTGVVDGLLLLGGAAMDAPFEPVDVTQILDRLQNEIAPLYSEKNIALNYDLQSITLSGNPVLLYRAFFNIVENAFKYTEENGRIAITSYEDKDDIVICVSNTGIVILADDLENIFQPFYRADKSRSRKIAGAGLGLSITKEIFDLHGATIAIRSEKESETVVEMKFSR